MHTERITHPAWLRITHWVNAVAFTIMMMSGWRIYDASPLFSSIEFPVDITLGGWLGGALLWHFAAMWLFVVNGVVYLGINIMTGRLGRTLFPLRLMDVWRDAVAAIRGQLSHADITRFNAVQKLAYLVAVCTMILIVASGLVIFKSVQFPILRTVMGGYDNARVVHFVCMITLAAFVVIHVLSAVFVPKTLLAMVRGYGR